MCALGQYFEMNNSTWEMYCMLHHAFFDDSGKLSDADNRIVVIAGYMAASPNIWGAFNEQWKHILGYYNLHWLHLKDLMNKESSEYAYLEWDWNKKRSVLEDFNNTIKANRLIGFAVAVDADGWRKLPPEIQRMHGGAQGFCFVQIIRLVNERIKRSFPNDQVSIMLDCDRNFTPDRFARFIDLRDGIPEVNAILQAFSVGEPKTFLPLQAADLLAWQTRKHLLRQMGGYEARLELVHLMETIPGYEPDYTAELWTEEALLKNLIKP